MAATYWSGASGKITFNAVDIPVVNWSGKESVDTFEFTNALSSGWKERGTQNKDFSGSATAVYDSVDSIPTTHFAVGASATALFYKGGAGTYVTCTVIIKSHSWKVSPRNPAAVEVDFEWESTGAVTHG